MCSCDPDCMTNFDMSITDGSNPRDMTTSDMSTPSPVECNLPIEGCFQTCITNKTSVSSCVGTCGVGNGVGCYALCEVLGTSLSTCKSYCGIPTASAERACYKLATTRGDSVSTARSYCCLLYTSRCV